MVRRVLISLIITASLFSVLNMVAFAGYVTHTETALTGVGHADGTLSCYSSRVRYTMDCTVSTAYLVVSGNAYEAPQNGGGSSYSIGIGGHGYRSIGQSYYPATSSYVFSSAYATYTATGFKSFSLSTNS